MKLRKFFTILVSLLVVASTILAPSRFAGAMPMDPTDESKVPHYFGPYPNWANSPFTLSDVTVEIIGDGSGAAATASVGGNGAVTGITITEPGIGYTFADVTISGAGTGATASAQVTPSGIVTGINVDAGGTGYTKPVVNLSGGGGTGTLAQVGNQLIERGFATDNEATVLVVVPVPLPTGMLQAFEALNQAAAGQSFAPSAGLSFNAYVLRPTATPDEYQVVFDSGLLTVPPLTDPAVSEVVSYPVPDVAVQNGDVLAFYGQGIPFDLDVPGDILSYPAMVAPQSGSTIALNSVEFPLLAQDRTYSIGASVVNTSGVTPLTNATATATGGVYTLTLIDAGSGYTNPTVDFDMPDAPDGVQAQAHAEWDATTGIITALVVDQTGSGYSSAPNVVIRDGTIHDPIMGGTGAIATATLAISAVTLDTFGQGYTSAPTVTITDPTGSGASATAHVSAGGVTGITLTASGSDYITTGGIRKFQDGLPVLCDPTAGWDNCQDNNLGQHIPIAVPDTTTFPGTDYYVIAVVQHREQMHSSLTPTLLREYVQLETADNASFSKHVALQTALLDGSTVPTLMPDGSQAVAVDDPHFLGPVIVANKDRAVRIVFYNLLPTGAEGDLFLPVDSSMMGSGMGPMDMGMDPMNENSVMDMVRNPDCTEYPKASHCFKDNRATLHLHGGITPWISDGTPHQWITPANEATDWPEGVSVVGVPDMVDAAGVPNCEGGTDGCMTFYYTNQQSARLMFYHDHSWGITRLNVYAGEAAGYIITDPTEQKLVNDGVIPSDQIPLIIQDRTFVPETEQLAAQDPTWDSARWGGPGNFWYHHVYMPAQNPGDPGGMSGYGRWMYGPWFWPPAIDAKYGPIPNPYFDPACVLDDPATWQYQTDPFCEPQLIPGTPNISVGMEQFNDTPLVNGTAYPTTTLEPKSYRFRVLNAANDRFWNLQWYIADPRTGTLSEVALNPDELAAAQLDPVVSPTPDTNWSPPGPSWIQIGTEGGFLPAPVVVPNQHVTWITDGTRFDVGNVDQHSLLLAPAERADVIVDFSAFAGKTLILYNDAPAAFPARVPSYDYYTGAPDLSPVGAPTILPGYGPNTRTIMQVNIAPSAPAPAFNLTALRTAFRHHADGSGVFESGQHPVIVGQAGYNSAYGTNFTASGWCNAPGSTSTRCDGYVRINEQGGDQFSFNTLRTPNAKFALPIEPKAIHDEMNAVSFDEFGRMTANLGLEAVPATPGLQNVILYPYVNPSTELIDATNLPTADMKVTPISTADGTQIWRFTHNGVDTHPIHFHLYDVQVLNRVTWDNIIMPPDQTELGWKDTVRMAPLQDTIVALRPIIPQMPFEIPNSIRSLNPMMPTGSEAMFNSTDASGNPTANIINQLVNYGWEYVYHCHILSHEEMDMMRPVIVGVPPIAPDGLSYTFDSSGLTLSWNDNSITETAFVIQKMIGAGAWEDVATIPSPLDEPNIHQSRTYLDSSFTPSASAVSYRVLALNSIGYGGEYMSLTVQSESPALFIDVIQLPPAAPGNLTAALQAGPQIALTWTDNATDETGFVIERSVNGAAFAEIATPTADSLTYTDTGVAAGNTYDYRIFAVNAAGPSAVSNTASVTIPALPPPAAPTNLTAVPQPGPSMFLTWTDNAANETGFIVERSINNSAFTQIAAPAARTGTGSVTFSDTTILVNSGDVVAYRVAAVNAVGPSSYSNTATVTIPALPPAAAPTNLVAALQTGPRVVLTWNDTSNNETGFLVQRRINGGAYTNLVNLPAHTPLGAMSYTDATITAGNTYQYRVASVRFGNLSAFATSGQVVVTTTPPVGTVPAAPSALTGTGTVLPGGDTVTLTWTDNATNELAYVLQAGTNTGFTGQTSTVNLGANATTTSFTGLPRGVRIYFRVAATNATGSSAWSNTFSILTP